MRIAITRIAVLGLLLVLATSCSGGLNIDTEGRDVVIKVSSKETIPKADSSGRDYRIYGELVTDDRSHPSKSDDGVFNVGDDIAVGQNSSSALYGRIQPNKTYLFHVVGKRYASAWLTSKWPNIVSAQEIG